MYFYNLTSYFINIYKINFKVKMNKSTFWPRKNDFFERAKNKKVIIYEYLALTNNYFKK